MILRMTTVFLLSLFLQNLVLNSGFGMETIIRAGQRPSRLWRVSVLLTLFSILATLLGWPIHQLLRFERTDIRARLLIFIVIVCLLYAAAAWLHRRAGRSSKRPLFTTAELIMAAFNNIVAVIPYYASQTALDLGDSLLLAVYAGLGFLLASWFYSGSAFLLHSEKLPAAFRGAPAKLLYIRILFLAFAGFSGAVS